jgi:hypothetical protein
MPRATISATVVGMMTQSPNLFPCQAARLDPERVTKNDDEKRIKSKNMLVH